MSGPDKPKVIDEEWSDERVKSHLITQPGGEGSDYIVLLKAYQAMRAKDFERFVGFFMEAGGNLNDTGETGETILDFVSQHRKGTDYARALESAGAKKTTVTGI
ncbi:MAG: PA4642 family protein [Marinobacter sp.]|uniref:PA4642 family protein n=1 Tax=Marinobacter sp. TaxID=50741 RepID=UPI001B670E20|nr:PA4642 family protein [Marinobacter sp.]MBQ0748304.1 PA4642 family protein [Marinobacter sp.]MBQ0816318.1 PA4642 family protein [Marinobacter sp.]|tara:strand:- start:801 stop:1112 length:312 start_codon:yes stop_codon:yes gene_type:complete